ncbi:MAG TPA: type II toxin-antitoxin system HicA family toxin [Tepidisphaeraceae bacterium]|nr:type II toxin-antitoxin system HicA family toxin [Tepidisphaeraceae bacterium]
MPAPERFAVVRKILDDKGYVLARISGSHHIFTKAGQPHLSIPVHGGKVKAHYVRQAKKAQ